MVILYFFHLWPFTFWLPLRHEHRNIDFTWFGDIPTQITSIAAVAAAIGAASASKKLTDLKLRGSQATTERDESAAREKVWSQATMIAGWAEGASIEIAREPNKDKYLPFVVARIDNPSLQAIFNVQVIQVYRGEHLGSARKDVIRPSIFQTFDIPKRHLDRVRMNIITLRVGEKDELLPAQSSVDESQDPFELFFHLWTHSEKGGNDAKMGFYGRSQPQIGIRTRP